MVETPPQSNFTAAPAEDTGLIGSVFNDKRELLAERLSLMLIDLGGLAYEMAIRNHFRLDVLVSKSAEIQDIDAELGQVDRLLSLGRSGAAGDCPNCGALYARGSAFCNQCGFELIKAGSASSAPHVAQPHESLTQQGLIKDGSQ